MFEGPLDLLLQLIEREELDITAISLVHVTNQYLSIIEEMGRRGMADLTAFLVIAAKLVLIKSRVLLPRPPSEGAEQEDDVADDLISQLEAYRRFKRAAQALAQWEEEGRHAYLRPVAAPAPQITYDLSDATLKELMAAAQEALGAFGDDEIDAVSVITVTIADQVALIKRRLSHQRRVRFDEILSQAASRVEVIVTLLAVLQLLKQDELHVWQEELFGPIFMTARDPEPTDDGAPAP
ncbi:MAG: segregation/condensation protein A [Anaerolineae bacterium]